MYQEFSWNYGPSSRAVVFFPSESLDMNFADFNRPNTSIFIGSPLSSREANFKELRIGDIIRKINGSAVSGCTFEGMIK